MNLDDILLIVESAWNRLDGDEIKFYFDELPDAYKDHPGDDPGENFFLPGEDSKG